MHASAFSRTLRRLVVLFSTLTILLPGIAIAAPASPSAPATKAAGAVAAPPVTDDVTGDPLRAAPPELPAFSRRPADAEIAAIIGGGIPVARTGGRKAVDAVENAELARTITAALTEGGDSLTASLGQFLERHPDTSWRAAILVAVGNNARESGRYSRAIDAYRQAWLESKDETGRAAREMANRAGAELATMYSRLGHETELSGILHDLGTRTLTGPSLEPYRRACELDVEMRTRPETTYLCGIRALDRVLGLHRNTAGPDPRLTDAHVPARGMSLLDLFLQASDLGMDLTPARLDGAARLPVPSIIHFSTGHFAAVLESREDPEGMTYRVDDPVSDGDRWLSEDVLREEGSGYFLIPASALAGPWRTVSGEEAISVLGRGPTAASDPWAYKDTDVMTMGDCGRVGMAGYNVSSLLVNLVVKDTPLVYQPILGPPVEVSFKHNERTDPSAPRPYGLSFGWTHNWFAYVDVPSPLSNDQNVYVYLRGGSREQHGTIINVGQTSIDEESGALLKCVSNGYTRTLPDGSVEKYTLNASVAGTNRTMWFLTRVEDPMKHGVTVGAQFVTFGVYQWRTNTLTDDTGTVTTFNYNTSNKTLTSVSIGSPDSRSIALTYYAGGALQTITDVIGLQSTVVYQADGRIQMLTTPYGQTSFNYFGSTPTSFERALQITDPNGDAERVEFRHGATGIPTSDPVGTVVTAMNYTIPVNNNNLEFRNTFYWNKKALAQYGVDYTKARIHHFLHKNGSTTSGWLESTKEPLENRVWYLYPGQTDSRSVGTTNHPARIGRVTESFGNTVTQQQIWDIEYTGTNNRFKPTKIVGPDVRPDQTTNDPAIRRVTKYVYSADGVDLTQVVQEERSIPGGTPTDKTILTLEYTNATYPHAVTKVTDAALQATTINYNGDGQVFWVNNARNEKTDFVYDTSKRLSKIRYPAQLLQRPDLTFTYDLKNRVDTANLTGWYTLTYERDDLDRLTKVTYPDGTFEQRTFDTVRKLSVVSIRDRLAHTTQFGNYDGLGRVRKITDAEQRMTNLTWCTCGSLETMTDSLNHVTTWLHDIERRPTGKQYHDGTQTTIVYEPATSRIASVTDALSRTTSYSYFADDNVQQVIYSGGSVTTPSVAFEYDINYDRVTRMTDGDGPTTYEYYPATSPAGTLGALQLKKVDGPRANDTVEYSYDVLGRPETQTVNGDAETMVYDQLGRVTSETNRLGLFTYGFDGLTSRIKTAHYPTAPVGNQQRRETYSYESAANQTFNLLRAEHRLPDQSVFQTFDYDTAANGRMDRIQENGTGLWDQFGYDATDRLTSDTDPPAQPVTFGYDSAGNRTQAGTSTWTYNAVNAITQQTAPVVRTFTTDSEGNTTSDGVRQYEWDVENRLTAIVEGTKRSEFSYDGYGRRTRIVEKSNGTVQSDLTYVWAGSQVAEERDSYGTRTRRFFSQGFFSAGQPGGFFLKDTHGGGGGDYAFDFGAADAAYQPVTGDWDGNGADSIGVYDTTTGTFFLRNSNSAGAADLAFSFGPSQSGWQPIAGDWNGDGVDTIGLYDPATGTFYLKNTNSAGAADVVFTFGPGGQGWIPVTGDWDNNGTDTIGVYDPSTGNFFLKNSNSSGPHDLAFSFGPAGTGWQPLAGDWDATAGDSIGLYDPSTGNFFLKNSNSAGAADLVYQFGLGLANYAALAGDWNGDNTETVGIYRTSTTDRKFFYTRDHLGSVRFVKDEAGNTVGSYSYGPWGETYSGLNSVKSPFGYAGMWRHERSGLYLTLRRAFDPLIGRWVNRDPIGERGGMNLLAYVVNSPVNYVDRYGEDVFGVTGGASAGIGGGFVGAAATASYFAGYNTATDTYGAGATYGAFAGGPYERGPAPPEPSPTGLSTTGVAFGLWGGAGAGFFYSNADSFDPLYTPSWAVQIIVPVIPLSVEISDAGNGNFTATATGGPSLIPSGGIALIGTKGVMPSDSCKSLADRVYDLAKSIGDIYGRP